MNTAMDNCNIGRERIRREFYASMNISGKEGCSGQFVSEVKRSRKFPISIMPRAILPGSIKERRIGWKSVMNPVMGISPYLIPILKN